MKEEYEKYHQELMKYMKNPPVSYVFTMGAALVTGSPVLTVGMRLAEYIKKKHEPFNVCLFKMIDSK